MPSFFFPTLFGLSLVGPLIAGCAALIGRKSLTMQSVVQACFAFFGAAGLIAGLMAWIGLGGGGAPVSLAFPGNLFPALSIDVWSAGFFALVNLGIVLSSLFAIGYLPRYHKTYHLPTLNFVSALFMAGMLLTILSSSVFSFLFFWEIMSLAAYFLVIADQEEASLKAGFLYVIMTHIGVVCLLIGFMILSQGNPGLTFVELGQRAASLSTQTLSIAFLFLLAGFGSKAGLVPLHQWLPYAHPQAPSHSSALMSGVMLKVAIYGFLRVTLFLFPVIPASWSILVLVLGLVSAFFGVLYAMVETDLKRLLAWSSIENVGLIFTMLGTGFLFRAYGLPSTPLFVAAGIHILNHTIFKSALFLSAGALISETHTRDLDEMGGLARVWPLFSMLFLALVFAASALPPFGTFYGEWLFLQSVALSIGQTTPVIGLLLGLALSIVALVGGSAVFAFVKTFSLLFLSKPRSTHAEHVRPLPYTLVLPVGLGALLSLGTGFFAASLASRLEMMFGVERVHAFSVFAPIASETASIYPTFLVFFFALLVTLVLVLRRLLTNPRVRVTDTWDCGQPLTARMEYTATGFASPIRFFFRGVLLSKKRMVTQQVAPENAWILTRHLETSMSSLWEEWFYHPLARAILVGTSYLKRLQSGVIQFYLLLIFVTLIAALVIAL